MECGVYSLCWRARRAWNKIPGSLDDGVPTWMGSSRYGEETRGVAHIVWWWRAMCRSNVCLHLCVITIAQRTSPLAMSFWHVFAFGDMVWSSGPLAEDLVVTSWRGDLVGRVLRSGNVLLGEMKHFWCYVYLLWHWAVAEHEVRGWIYCAICAP